MFLPKILPLYVENVARHHRTRHGDISDEVPDPHVDPPDDWLMILFYYGLPSLRATV